jgi:hypothetical protein
VTAAIPDGAGVLAELRRWIEASWDPELSLREVAAGLLLEDAASP